MNEYDSAKITDILVASHSFILTQSPAEADLIVLNTCSIREKAAEKLFSDLGRLRKIKKKKSSLVIAVGGCVAMQEQQNIFKRAPYVDIVFGPQNLHRLPEMYNKVLQKEKHIIDTTPALIEKFDYFPRPQFAAPSAYVSIMEGCNKFCSYCIVPYTRGREVSRRVQDILVEVGSLAQMGAREIHLLGQNVNVYQDPTKPANFADLISVIAKNEKIKRIRFTTSHPAEFTEDLIAIFKTEHKLANQLHLPVQSGSNRILKLMRRGYTHEEYREIVNKIRETRPDINIATDIIVGFPGESEIDFSQTLELVRDINFDFSYSFIYSPRPNTAAAKLEDNVTLTEKKERLFILQNQLSIQGRSYSEKMIGTVQKVLIDSRSKKNPDQFSGRTENNRVVNFLAPGSNPGDIIDIKITDVFANSLRGCCNSD